MQLANYRYSNHTNMHMHIHKYVITVFMYMCVLSEIATHVWYTPHMDYFSFG